MVKLFSSAASQRKPVTTVRADYEFAIAFRVPPPPAPPPPPVPRRLKRRCGGRHFFHGRRVDRNGTPTRSTSNRKPSRQAEKEECVAHEYLPGSPRRERQRFRCCSEAHVYASMPCGLKKIDVYLFQAKLDPMIAGPEGGPSSDMQRFED